MLPNTNSADNSQNAAFTGQLTTIFIENAGSFAGNISGIGVNDTIDLVGLVATSAAVGVNNVLTVQKSGGGSFTLQLDPNQNLSGFSIGVSSDGGGGTNLTLKAASPLIGATLFTPSSGGTALEVYTVDPATGAIAQIGSSFAVAGGAGPLGLQIGAEAAINGRLYFVGDNGEFYTVDTQTGQLLNAVAATPTAQNFVADNLTGELVGINAGHFGVVNPTTGSFTAIGSGSFGGVALGAEAAVNGKLYVEATPGILDTIDINTGQVTNSVATSVSNFVADDLTGKLVGVGGGKFGIIDPATGSFTAVGPGDPSLQGIFLGNEAAVNGTLYVKEGPLYAINISTGAIAASSSNTTAPDFVAEQTSLQGSPPPTLPGATIAVNGGTVTAAVNAGQSVGIDPLVADFGGTIPMLILQGPGTADIIGPATINTLEVASGASLVLEGSTITTDPVTVDAGGNISGFGKITGAETVNGTVTAQGGTLDLTGNISGSGKLTFATGASLQLEGTVAAAGSITFTGTGELLTLGATANVMAPISGFGAGDAIGLEGQQVTSAVYATNTHALVLSGNGGVFDLNLAGTYLQSNFSVTGGEAVFSAVAAPPTISDPHAQSR